MCSAVQCRIHPYICSHAAELVQARAEEMACHQSSSASFAGSTNRLLSCCVRLCVYQILQKPFLSNYSVLYCNTKDLAWLPKMHACNRNDCLATSVFIVSVCDTPSNCLVQRFSRANNGMHFYIYFISFSYDLLCIFMVQHYVLLCLAFRVRIASRKYFFRVQLITDLLPFSDIQDHN